MSRPEKALAQPLNRRQCLRGAMALAATEGLAGCRLIASKDHNPNHYTLVVEPFPISLMSNTATPAWTFNKQYPSPVLRLRQNQPVTVEVINLLDEATTIHWHGIRLNNAADGVPYLTQQPIAPGQRFLYQFTCPDAGTFWYHPHMNSLEQLSRGLVGLIVVEEEVPVAFDADITLMLKDWHLNQDGSFKAFSDPRAAARTGTLGNFQTINGLQNPNYTLPAGGWVRLRIANVDNTRVYTIACSEPAMVIAVEGNPLAVPTSLLHHPLGAGMRVDLAIKMPDQADTQVKILDQKGRFGFDLCGLIAGSSGVPTRQVMPKLPLNPIPEVNVDLARRIPMIFEWAGALSPAYGEESHHGSGDQSIFWTINKRPWHGHGPHELPEPIAKLTLGEHVIFELYNATPHHHPIHLHGYTFTVLSSNQRDLTPYHTDTVLMQKYERIEVAIVADNPGNWMFHCHVIEHMKTGLMGYIQVK